ncbi:MAG TPA: formyl transferase [Candidatus Dormibacteraeota bacterium]|nr:formyl transferase [Candidatus Dormibacteraeota bacterium]
MTPARRRLAVLCSDGWHNRYLVAVLRQRFDVAAVVVETSSGQVRRLRERHRWRDLAARSYHRWRRRWVGAAAFQRRFFAGLLGSGSPPPPDMVVDDVNDAAVVALLARVAPDATVVMSTSLLRAATLQAAGPTVLNVHGGVLPDYRGNQCMFFALLAGDLDGIGSTIHFVDDGIDTGDVVEVVRPPAGSVDLEWLYCHSQKLAIDRLADLLEAWEQGADLPRWPQRVRGRLYRNRDRTPLHDLLLWWRLRSMRFSAR